MRLTKDDLLKGLSPKAAEGVLRVREGKVDIKAGFDGEYGTISIFDANQTPDKNEEQLKLF
ncbi:MAG: hypothetical protein BWY16_00077 [Candidatus Omnitrophica bacterium ADurb.Bin205]|nr:MAG: hypothetical protein BWY16_00077 [Candidatus Omnitrophica bacterium ADurb.Bin205]